MVWIGAIVSWKIADVIDFEWLLADDGELDRRHFGARDARFPLRFCSRPESDGSRLAGNFLGVASGATP